MLTDVSHYLNLFKIGLVSNESLFDSSLQTDALPTFFSLPGWLGSSHCESKCYSQSLAFVENTLEILKHFFTLSIFKLYYTYVSSTVFLLNSRLLLGMCLCTTKSLDEHLLYSCILLHYQLNIVHFFFIFPSETDVRLVSVQLHE